MSRNTGRGWNVNFRTPGALVMLTGDLLPTVNDPAKGVMCAVSVDRARDDLMADVEALALSLGLDAEPQSEGFGGSDIRIWSKFGEMTLTYASNPADPRAVISLSHQTVTAGN